MTKPNQPSLAHQKNIVGQWISAFKSRGYLGVIFAVICACLLSGLGLLQSLKIHQRQARKALIQETLTAQIIPDYDQEYLGHLKLREVSFVPQQTDASSDQHEYAALSTLQETKSGLKLDQPEDKAWFDAYWKDKSEWFDAQGHLWGKRTLTLKAQQTGLPTDFQLLAKLSATQPPRLPWLWFVLCGLVTFMIAMWACFYFCSTHDSTQDSTQQKKAKHSSWSLPLLTTISASPLVILSCLEIMSREQDTGIKVAEGPLVASLALIPMLILGLSQYKTAGKSSSYRVAYTYMMPTLLSVGILVFVPFSLGVGLSFMRHHQGEFTWVGLSHFIDILSASDYPLTHPLNFYFTLAVTLFWTASNVVLHTSIGLSLALLLNRKGLKLKGIYRALLIIPWAIPNYITALIWKGMFNQQYGLINKFLAILGIEPVSWMGSFWGAMAANISTNTWLGFPFMMVVTLGALQSIPQDLYEAAHLAGASKWQSFKSITLPLLKPALLPAVILGSVWTFNMFNIIYLVSGGQPGGASDILITEAYRWAFEQDRYGYAAAYSLIIFFILLGYARLTQRMTQAAEEVYS